MPHRIRWISHKAFMTPLVHEWENPKVILDFEEAGELLQNWRQDAKTVFANEESLLEIAQQNQTLLEELKDVLFDTLATEPDSSQELSVLTHEIEKREFLSEEVLPEALDKINMGELTLGTELSQYISDRLTQYEERIPIGKQELSIRDEVSALSKLKIVSGGKKAFIAPDQVVRMIGRSLGTKLIEELSKIRYTAEAPIKGHAGKIHGKGTYTAAIRRTGTANPELTKDDLRFFQKEEFANLYFVLDMSDSMRDCISSHSSLSRFDGALLTTLALKYFFHRQNRRQPPKFAKFKMYLVPISGKWDSFSVEDSAEFLRFLKSAQPYGATPMSSSILKAVEHSRVRAFGEKRDQVLIIVTDGKPNVLTPAFPKDSWLERFTGSNDYMTEVGSILYLLKHGKTKWKIIYILISNPKHDADLYAKTERMLRGTTRPVTIDAANLDALGRLILRQIQRL
ncbi:MAG: hypothetical protein ACFFBD_00640 [Candidatus Hodarchaeota archaeon]